MAHPTVEEICELLEGYAWELQNASGRADAAGKAAVEDRLAEVRSALEALKKSAEQTLPEPLPEVETAGALAGAFLEAAQERFGEGALRACVGEIHDGGWYALWAPLENVGEVEVRARLSKQDPPHPRAEAG